MSVSSPVSLPLNLSINSSAYSDFNVGVGWGAAQGEIVGPTF